MANHKPEEYKVIKAWGKMLFSYPYYISAEQQRASDMDAPLDACYERSGVWHCLSDHDMSPITRERVEAMMKDLAARGEL